MKKPQTKNLVYSTDTGRASPQCGHPLKQCRCKEKSLHQDDGVVRVSRQTKGRKGSGVCLITGVDLGGAELKKLAKELKRKCGSAELSKTGLLKYREIIARSWSIL